MNVTPVKIRLSGKKQKTAYKVCRKSFLAFDFIGEEDLKLTHLLEMLEKDTATYLTDREEVCFLIFLCEEYIHYREVEELSEYLKESLREH